MAFDVKRLLNSSFFKDWSLKIVFLVVAVVLWLFVATGSTYVHELGVPISFEGIRQGRVLADEVPKRALVRYRGSGRDFLRALLTSDLRLILDLQTITEYYNFALQSYFESHPEGIHTPRGLELELLEIISPDTIRIRLDAFARKNVPIVSRVEVKTEQGYTVVGGVQLRPATAEISGPKNTIDGISAVHTEPTVFENSSHDVSKSVRIEALEEPLVNVSPGRLQVFASVQSIVEITVPDIAVHVLNVPENLRAVVDPSSVSLTVAGGIKFLSKLAPSDVLAFIDYNRDWKSDQRLYEPNIEVPPNVLSWQGLRPEQVEVVIIRERR